MEIIKSYKKNKDARGSFCGIINSGRWQEINYLETEKGKTRGGHYHRKTKELFFIISGEINVSIKNIKTGKSANYKMKQQDIFIIEPYELHIFTAQKKCQWINVLSHKFNDKKPDIHQN